MADFINPPVEVNPENQPKVEVVEEKKNICVVSITNGSPYDSSQLKNNANTYYTEMNYQQLRQFYYTVRHQRQTENMVYKTVD